MPSNDTRQNLKPQERLRVKIDKQLVDAPWHVGAQHHCADGHDAVALAAWQFKGREG